MKIGILSDPHKKEHLQKQAIDMLKEKGAKMLIHAGDFKLIQNIQMLQDSNLPYVGVFGNNDKELEDLAIGLRIYKEPYEFEVKNTKITLMHKPLYFNSDSDIYIFGHTHAFKCNYNDKVLVLNPGEICAREKPISECALLNIKKDKFKITYYYKSEDDTKYKSKEIVYER